MLKVSQKIVRKPLTFSRKKAIKSNETREKTVVLERSALLLHGNAHTVHMEASTKSPTVDKNHRSCYLGLAGKHETNAKLTPVGQRYLHLIYLLPQSLNLLHGEFPFEPCYIQLELHLSNEELKFISWVTAD